MRKRLLVGLVMLALLLVAGQVRADTTTTPSTGFTFSEAALTGDMVYDLRESALGYGPSYTLGTFGPSQMFAVKGMYVVFPESEVSNKLGAGVSVSIPKVLTAIGVSNVPDWFVVEVGVLGLVDFEDSPEISCGLYCTLIKWTF